MGIDERRRRLRIMRRVALVAALVAALAVGGCGAVARSAGAPGPKPVTSATAQPTDNLQVAADKLSGDKAWAGANKARIVSVYADLVNDRVKVLVSAGTSANTVKAVAAAAKKATGLDPAVEAAPQRAASKPQTPAPCSCMDK